MLRKKVISIMLCLSLLLGLFIQVGNTSQVFASEMEDTNSSLLVNPGFESDLVDNNIVGWAIQSGNEANGTISLSNDYVHSGASSLLFEDTSSTSRFRVLSNPIPVVKDDTVTYNVYAYKEKASDQTHGVAVVLQYFNENGGAAAPNTEKLYPASQVQTGVWQVLNVETIVPAGTAYIKVGMYSGDPSLTKIYFDDAVVSIKTAHVDPPESNPPVINPPDVSGGVLNGNLEAGLVDGKIPGWTVFAGQESNGRATLSNEYALSGTQSLLFEDIKNGNTGSRFTLLSDAISVSPSATVTFNVNVYKERVEDQTHGVQPVIYFYNAAGNTTGLNAFVNYSKDSVAVGEWKLLSVTATVPANTTHIKVGLYSGDVSLTKVFMDDAVVKIMPFTSDSIVNAGFELPLQNNKIVGWELAPGTEGTLELNSTIKKSGNNSLYFKDSNTALNTRVYSDLFKVEGGKTVITEANVYVIHQSHNIVLEFYYYDAAGTQVGFNQSLFSGNTLGTNKWSTMKLQTELPAQAVSAKIGLNSGDISTTEAYFDDISMVVLAEEVPLERDYQAPVNLGDMVYVNLGQAAAIQTNANGVNEVYFITNGDPGTFYAVELETGKFIFSQVIPNTEATWAITIGEDKNVYFSTTGDGVLYRYIPTEKKIERLGYNTAENWVWDLATIGDKVYGGTYHATSDGKLFEYDITTGQFRNYGVVQQGQNYVRGIGVDEQYIYAAMGTTIQLFKVDRVTGEKTEIIVPDISGNTGTAGDVYLHGNKIFFASSTQNMVVLDKDTLEIDATFAQQAMISEPDPANPNHIYYVFQKKLYKYDMELKTKTQIPLTIDLPDTPRYKDFAWVTLQTGEKANETVLAVITQYGETMLIDPDELWVKFINLEISSNSVSIQALEHGPDGRIYMGGYQRGMSIYNPFTNRIEQNIPNFAQPEGIGFLNGDIYYGTYVGAIMYKYDLSKPTEFNVNPSLAFDIEHQDRPFAITNGDNKLFVGTVPDYGYLGGALAIYDEPTNRWSQYNHDLFAPNQSVMSLAYRDGYLFGGTSVWGGLGINPSESEAVIFVWDTTTNTLVRHIKLSDLGLEIDEVPRMIGEISFGPDGLLWGVVDGTIFALNVDDITQPTIEKSKMIFPSLYNTSKWLDYELEWAPDGMIYSTLGRKLLAIDPETLQYKVLDDTFTNEMTLGIDGSIYYAPGAKTFVYRIVIPETDATLSSILLDGKPLASFSPGVLHYKANFRQIEAISTQHNATVSIQNTDNGGAIITVIASDGKSTLTYTIEGIPYQYDVTGDGLINISDLIAVAKRVGTYDPQYDVDHNGVIDHIDVVLLSQYLLIIKSINK